MHVSRYKVLIPLTVAAVVAAAPAFADEAAFDVAGFTRVDAGEGLTVEIVAGGDFAVTAEGTARALRRLQVETRGDTLVLGQKARGAERFSPLLWALADNTLVVRVSLPALDAVAASSGSDVTAQGGAAATFAADASSGAALAVTGIDAARVTLAASSGADLSVAGHCGALDVAASSGAGIAAKDLACDSATAEASSGASLALTAGTVVATASSGADISVWGAREVEADHNSGGTVEVHD